MAVRKAKYASNRGRQKKKASSGKKIPWGVVFWLGFIILLICLYFYHRKAIHNGISIVQRELFSRDDSGDQAAEPAKDPTGVIQVPPPIQGGTAQPGQQPEAPPPLVEPPPSEAVSPTVPSQVEPQDAQPQTLPQAQGTEASPGTADLRDRALYFTRIGSDGTVLRVRSDRRLPASDSPLRDAIQALVAGPSAEESQRGLISLIPVGTRLLSIAIRGETAYINFNEEFQYNPYGAEGYAGQLRQIVYTATEFPSVRDVQILIEGSRIDYLGDNTWIGSPLNRDMF